ncbi:hypothetical protein HGB07_05735 [Candidatus Roizmanbacteria bacterium]|nr:hypothetical protein [Candidatus Roizmanbacteria bacterium]
MKQLTKREKVQKLAIEKGSCLCSSPSFPFKCPCNVFRKTYKCHCAGDDTGMTQEEWAEDNLSIK